jgi:hypothetical protein
MEYEPGDHIPNRRHVAAAWIICLGIIGPALVMTAARPTLAPPVNAAQAAHAGAQASAPNPCPLAGVRNPAYTLCRSGPPDHVTTLAKGANAPISVPANSCS